MPMLFLIHIYIFLFPTLFLLPMLPLFHSPGPGPLHPEGAVRSSEGAGEGRGVAETERHSLALVTKSLQFVAMDKENHELSAHATTQMR